MSKKRQEYDFEKAFKYYEEEKEIESCVSGNKYFKNKSGRDYFIIDKNDNNYCRLYEIPLEEIRGKWYIND